MPHCAHEPEFLSDGNLYVELLGGRDCAKSLNQLIFPLAVSESTHFVQPSQIIKIEQLCQSNAKNYYVIIVLICISMVSGEMDEHLFIFVLAICIFSSVNHLFITSVPISIILLVFFLLLCKIILC